MDMQPSAQPRTERVLGVVALDVTILVPVSLVVAGLTLIAGALYGGRVGRGGQRR